MWNWTGKDLDALAATGATFSSMTGYLTGTLAGPDGAGELLRLENLDTAVDHPGTPFAKALPLVGEIQVADVPGRCEPGTGEIHYPAVAAAPHRLGYQGVVGLEGWARGEPGRALDRFRDAFGPEDRGHLCAAGF